MGGCASAPKDWKKEGCAPAPEYPKSASMEKKGTKAAKKEENTLGYLLESEDRKEAAMVQKLEESKREKMQEESTKEELKVEEPEKEELKVEEPEKEELKVEEPKKEELKVEEEPKKEELIKIEEPKKEQVGSVEAKKENEPADKEEKEPEAKLEINVTGAKIENAP